MSWDDLGALTLERAFQSGSGQWPALTEGDRQASAGLVRERYPLRQRAVSRPCAEERHAHSDLEPLRALKRSSRTMGEAQDRQLVSVAPV